MCGRGRPPLLLVAARVVPPLPHHATQPRLDGRRVAILDDLDGVSAPTPETNIVVADVSGAHLDAGSFVDACADRDVGCVPVGDTTVRFCTHLDVDRGDVDRALDRIGAVL